MRTDRVHVQASTSMPNATRAASILDVSGLEAGYTSIPILRGVSVSCSAGEVTTIIGPNGCGKSTLLKSVIGLLPPRGGKVRLGGEDVTGLPPEALLRRGLALVPQIRSVFPRMSVEENLQLGGHLLGNGRLVRERIAEVMALLPRLHERRKQLAGTLSGGEQRLLELGRALILKPKVLLLDEPSAMLAPSILEGLFTEIRRITQGGTAILLVEQNIRKAFEITDFVYVFDYGTNFISGTPQQCMQNPDLASLFLG